jgi:hypothetical protein
MSLKIGTTGDFTDRPRELSEDVDSAFMVSVRFAQWK